MDHLPMHTFRICVERYSGNSYVKSFNCFDQFLYMAFQLTHRESLQNIEICLQAHNPKFYHIGIRVGIYSTVEMNKGVICDHTFVLARLNSSAEYPKTLLRLH